jgi:chromosome segregation ATPase
MSMLSFLSNFGAAKADHGITALIQGIVSLDPQTATEAQLREMEQHLDILARQAAAEHSKLQTLTTARQQIEASFNGHMQAGDILQHQIDAAADPADKASKEHSLETLVNIADEESKRLDEAKKDEADQGSFYEQIRAAVDEAGTKLKAARHQLESAERDMAHTRQERELAEARAQHAAELSGLHQTSTGLDIALDAMHRQAEKNRQATEAATTKTNVLKPAEITEDPNIAAAMEAVSGGARPTSAADRFAALKAKQG